MKIKLQKRKLVNGMISLYLEYCKGYSKDKAGRVRHKREMENLNIQLFENPRNSTERLKNKKNKILADMILTKRQAEINEGKYGFNNDSKANINLIEYFSKLTEQRKSSKGNYGNWDSCMKQLIKYCDPDTTTFKDIDEKFVKGFKDFLLNEPLIMETRKLSLNKSMGYLTINNKRYDIEYLDENYFQKYISKVAKIANNDEKIKKLDTYIMELGTKTEKNSNLLVNQFLLGYDESTEFIIGRHQLKLKESIIILYSIKNEIMYKILISKLNKFSKVKDKLKFLESSKKDYLQLRSPVEIEYNFMVRKNRIRNWLF